MIVRLIIVQKPAPEILVLSRLGAATKVDVAYEHESHDQPRPYKAPSSNRFDILVPLLHPVVAVGGRFAIVDVLESVDQVGNCITVGAPQRTFQQFFNVADRLEKGSLSIR